MSLDINIKQKSKLLLWAMPPVIIGIFFASFLLKISQEKLFQIKNTENINEAMALKPFTPQEKTSLEYSYFVKNINKKPKVLAKAYLVGDLENGNTILEKNSTEKLPIASVSKLMTALVFSDVSDKEDLIPVTKQALKTEGENGNLILNEKIKAGEILYPLLLESSNDAAEAIALHFGRNVFMQKMNEKAKDLEIKKTHFEDPSGLSPGNESTPADLFKLVQHIKEKNSDLLKITTEKSFKNKKHAWFSNSQFLRKEGYLGGKSGYTDEALQTVVSLFSIPLGENSNRSIAIVLLGSKDRRKDVENILKYLRENIYYGKETDISSAWVKNIPQVEDQNFVSFLFAGDIMLDRGVRNSVVKNFNNDYSALFEKLDMLKKDDIVFANLEGVASDKGKDIGNLYSFRMNPSIIPALSGAGINILSVANNHIGDWGRLAYIDTLGRLKENEILYTGGGMNIDEAQKPVILEKYGIKIGFLGFSDKGPEFMKADKESAGILLANNPDFDEIIKNASKQVDYLIVSFHFGEEYQTKHNKRQEDLAHKAIEDGAKIVIGHHPHVVEDTEVYKNGYIAYSLGNFIFDQSWSEPTMQGMLLELKLDRNGAMSVRKNIIKLNSAFQPDKIIKGAEEKVKFK